MITEKSTIPEILNDPRFIDYVDQGLTELARARSKRPSARKGYHYKKDAFDKLTAAKQFNTEYFVNNIGLIWIKKSNLSSEIRNFIQAVCTRALQRTLQAYAEPIVVPKKRTPKIKIIEK
jgi:hypothetical protein